MEHIFTQSLKTPTHLTDISDQQFTITPKNKHTHMQKKTKPPTNQTKKHTPNKILQCNNGII